MSVTATYKILDGDAGFTALSSGGVSSYVSADGAQLPYTILFADDSDPLNSKGNQVVTEMQDVIVACFATTTTQARAMARSAKQILDKYAGTVSGVVIKKIDYRGIEAEDYDRELKKASVEYRFRVTYQL